MNEISQQPPDPHGDADDESQSKLVPQLAMMFRALLASPVRSALFMLGGALFVIVVATSITQIRLNSWNQPFYDALSHHNIDGFLHQLGVFGIIAGVLLVLNVAQRWVGEMLKVKLREGLGRDLIENWMRPMRAFRLANAGPIGVNPDQRMHEDARHLTELSSDLGAGLLQAGILVTMFVDVLWRISAGFSLSFHGRAYSIPGYMVWAAILYAGSASLLSYWAGKNLIKRNADRYAREADFRFSLVRANEHVDAIALSGGEADEARRIEIDMYAVLAATKRLVLGLTNLTWVTAGYGWFTLVAPIIAAAPLYFFGNLSFGGLMMAAGAFTQVQSSLRWFVDNFSQIADWRATLLRVADFRRAVIATDSLHDVESQITYEDGESDQFRIHKLEIASPAGATMLKEADARIEHAERVLIVGEPGTGKTLLFRALAGLWPWGAGTVSRPKGKSILYMPRTAYWSPGTMREALAYPGNADDFTHKAYTTVLTRFKLEQLKPRLDKAGHWEQELNEDQLLRLSFARVLLHNPEWILVDEVLDSLDSDTLELVVDVLSKELKGSAVIHIGRQAADDKLFKRALHLVKDPNVRKLPHKRARRAKAATAKRSRRA